MSRLVFVAGVLVMCGAASAAESTLTADHVTVTYSGIGEPYATAMARAVADAHAIASADFGFDMPETISLRIICAPGQKMRLFNDGRDRFVLDLDSPEQLAKPATSGTFHLYGLCHEVGHLAQYRPIAQHDWMTTAAAEGWAHYLGSRLVDGVFAREGDKLWPDAYDYRADGMARLTRQLAASGRSETDIGAGLWMELAGIVGDKGLAAIFKVWGQATVDPADPGPALAKALRAANPDPRLAAWWQKAEPVFVLKRAKSAFVSRTAMPKDLAGRPAELARDDGASAGKASLAGGGHAVRFDAPSDSSYVTAVAIYGSRYGGGAATETFHVWLCDADFKALADFTFPYSAFDREAKWVRLAIKPTLVPEKFIVCAGFNPSASSGVFVHHDKAPSGHSLTGLPGAGAAPFAKGDWMIRPMVDQAKASGRAKRGN